MVKTKGLAANIFTDQSKIDDYINLKIIKQLIFCGKIICTLTWKIETRQTEKYPSKITLIPGTLRKQILFDTDVDKPIL